MGLSLWESLRWKGNSMSKFSGSHPKINNRRKTNQMTSRRWKKMLLTKKQAKFTIFILGDYKIVTLFKTHALWPTSDVYQLLNTTHHIQASHYGSLPPPRSVLFWGSLNFSEGFDVSIFGIWIITSSYQVLFTGLRNKL